MASVHLEFAAPDVPDLTTLKIYEALEQTGPFAAIETVTAIGTYPSYISEYTTTSATNENYWFAIEWIDSKGASSNLSQPVQGNTSTALGVIVDRVMLRDGSLNKEIVIQEAEAALYSVGIDPYGSASQMTPVQERGLTNLTLAMCYLTGTASGSGSSTEYVAGIVSQKVSDTAISNRADAVKGLLAAANKDLGIGLSYIGLISLVNDTAICGGGTPQLFGAELDQSRLLVEVL